MNLAVQPALPPAGDAPAALGVYVELRQLAAMEFKARGFSFLPRQPVHSLLAGRRASRLRGRGLNFEELRGYLPGDDVRNIDWRVTARLRAPHVRVYTEERDRPCLLLIDQRLSMFFGSRRAMKSVVAAELAALAAWRVFHAQDRVAAIVFDDREHLAFKPLRSREHVMRILGKVATKNRALRADDQTAANKAMLNTVLKMTAQAAAHDALICLISDGYGADSETVRWATELTAHNDLLTLLVYDPLEANLPAAGRLSISDGIANLEFEANAASTQQGFADQFANRLERMRTIARQRGAPLLPISTADDPVRQVQRHLGYSPPARR